jgi:hypothetical protein
MTPAAGKTLLVDGCHCERREAIFFWAIEIAAAFQASQ